MKWCIIAALLGAICERASAVAGVSLAVTSEGPGAACQAAGERWLLVLPNWALQPDPGQHGNTHIQTD